MAEGAHLQGGYEPAPHPLASLCHWKRLLRLPSVQVRHLHPPHGEPLPRLRLLLQPGKGGGNPDNAIQPGGEAVVGQGGAPGWRAPPQRQPASSGCPPRRRGTPAAPRPHPAWTPRATAAWGSPRRGMQPRHRRQRSASQGDLQIVFRVAQLRVLRLSLQLLQHLQSV